MAETTAPQRPVMLEGEVDNGAVSFSGKLDAGESLAGTPTVVDEGTSATLTITAVSVNVTELEINGANVPAGEAVQFNVSGQLFANSPYSLMVTATSDATPPATKKGRIILTVEK